MTPRQAHLIRRGIVLGSIARLIGTPRPDLYAPASPLARRAYWRIVRR